MIGKDGILVMSKESLEKITTEAVREFEKQQQKIVLTYSCHVCGKQYHNSNEVGVIKHGIMLRHCYGKRNVRYCVSDDKCFKAACDDKWGKIFDV